MERRALLQSIGLAPLGFIDLRREGECAGSSAATGAAATDAAVGSARSVIEAALALGLGGGYDSKWTGTGVPEEVLHGGERQCAQAVDRLGVGREVPLDQARAGDFAQLWRVSKQPSGHSVLFLAWLEVDGRRVGFSYLSSQGSTDGIGYSVEFFADAELGKGRVDRPRVYFARLGA